MSFALYRKYRPQTFEHLIGQTAVRTTLLEALKKGKLSHAYLFSGPRGTGKTTSARLIAKAIQCENRKENGEPCEECNICVANSANENMDLIEIDAASNRGIDDIRDLREKIRFAPSLAKSKVYIIDEVHMLSKEAFNALLKSLEEPPENVYFILATTEIHKIPETIISRCQRYDFKRIGEKQIVERLKYIAEAENIDFEIEALEILAKSADGGMRDAISLMQQFSNGVLSAEIVRERLGLSKDQNCESLYGALGSGDTQKGLKIIQDLHLEGFDLQEFTSSFLGLLRSKMHDAVFEQKQAVLPNILNWISLFDEAWMKLKKTSIATLPLEIALIRATQKFEVGVMPIRKEATTIRQDGLLHIEAVRKQVPQILKEVENVSIRTSFQTGNLINIDSKILKFQFSSQFHYDKVNSPEGIVTIESAVKKILGSEFNILFELDPAVKEMDWEVIEEKTI
ncbi:MAG: DNA polymerase III subunit gamma/tau [Patescibacteria group bacterium]